MIIGNGAIQQLVSKAVSHTRFDPTAQDAYTSAMAGASAPLVSLAGGDEGSASSSTGDKGYDESFAKMMVKLKAALASTTDSVTDDAKAAAAAAFSASSDKQLAASDSVTKTVDKEIASVGASDSGSSSSSSIKDQFSQYMNQSDAEKVRQQLTGVSKEEYDAMTPEQQAAVNSKVAALQKEQQQVAVQDINNKIAMAKAEMA